MKLPIKRQVLPGALLVLALMAGGYLAGQMGAVAASNGGASDGAAKPACISCHPFEKLAAQKPSFKAPSGEIVNPHMYVPHNERKPENVPDCLNCHTEHPIPPQGKIDLSRVNVENCYVSCHHKENFEPCGNCHGKK